MRSAMLSCAFASAILSQTAFLSQNAVAGSSEAGQIQTVQAQPGLRARPEYRSGRKNRRRAEAASGGRSGRPRADVCTRRRSKSREGQRGSHPAVDEETLSLYPTAAQCGECHKQIYEEWSSSQHAYASISPMFHEFEQKFQELTQGTVGTFCVRCHQQVGTQLGERAKRRFGREPDLARGRELHHLPPGQGAVRQGQRRAPGRAGQDLEPVYGSGEKRHQRRPRQQGNLLRQNQHRRARQRHPQRHDHERPDHQVGVLRQLPPGCRQPGHQAGDRLGSVSRQPGTQSRRHLPGLPHGQGSPESPRAMRPRPPPWSAARRSTRDASMPITASSARAIRSPTPASSLTTRRPRPSASRIGWSSTGAPAGAPPSSKTRSHDGKIKVDFPKRWADPLDREDATAIIEENLAKLDERDKLRKQVMENSSQVDGPYIKGDTEGRQGSGVLLQDQEHQYGTQPAVRLPGCAAAALGERRPRRSRRQEHLGVGLRRQQRRHGQSAQPGCRGWPHQDRTNSW